MECTVKELSLLLARPCDGNHARGHACISHGQQYLELDPHPDWNHEAMTALKYVVVSALVGLGPITLAPVYSEASRVPDEVANWFRTAARSALTSDGESGGDPLSVSLGLTDPEIGEPIQVFSVDDMGNFVGLEEWTAPLSSGGTLVGTITAWRDPSTGVIDLAVYDDAVSVAWAVDEIVESETQVLLMDPFGEGRALLDPLEDRVVPLEGLAEDMGELTIDEYQSGVEEAGVVADQILADGNSDLAGGASGGFSLAHSVRDHTRSDPLLAVGSAILSISGLALLRDTVRRRRDARAE